MPTLPTVRVPPAAIIGSASFLLLGWASLLVPSLIRSIERDFGQSDAGLGIFYFVYALTYAAGSLGGGALTERLGRRRILAVSAVIMGVGLGAIGVVPAWAMVMLAALPAGLGSGAIDGGVNGLFLDLFPNTRGRSLNGLHLFFGIGALLSPLVVGGLVDAGVAWQALIVGTALVAVLFGGLIANTKMPDGRHDPGVVSRLDGRGRFALQWPLVVLGIAIAAYVASEVGVSDWLVRFLAAAPLSVATGSLSLYWAGLALGRLVSARYGDRFDHNRFATYAVAFASVALIGAVLVPSLPVSVALFGLVGFASGPVFPMIVAVGGERFPDRSAAVGGFLTGVAVVGATIYPPVMGFLSVEVGLGWAMLGTAVLGLAAATALVLAPKPSIGGEAQARIEAITGR
ncbi:MAG TPA: MFS transporter [Candidatus Limnocylindrales bacterium]